MHCRIELCVTSLQQCLSAIDCLRRTDSRQQAPSGCQALPQVNGVIPQKGQLQHAPPTAQKAGISEALLQAAKANGIQLQSHG